MLPDRSVLIGQKLVENAKIKKNSNATFEVIFKQCGVFEKGGKCRNDVLLLVKKDSDHLFTSTAFAEQHRHFCTRGKYLLTTRLLHSG